MEPMVLLVNFDNLTAAFTYKYPRNCGIGKSRFESLVVVMVTLEVE